MWLASAAMDDDMLHSFQSDDAVAKLVEAVLDRVADGEVTEQLEAIPYERSDERQGYGAATAPAKSGLEWVF
ncbi:MAG: hypothetical protein ACLFS8_00015 [Clostridia bacterium]